MTDSLQLDALERASGVVLGIGPRRVAGRGGGTPLTALEEVIRPALMREPCLVSFSGGRDSSAVLAVATSLARRDGLALPVPVTNRFAVGGAADEADWQERVVSHLRLQDWIRLEHDDGLDCLGPVARHTLLSHGLLWPFNVHFHVPLLREARGGALLTGLGGDEMLAGSPRTEVRHLLRTRRRDDLARLAFALSPRRLRQIALRLYGPEPLGWLRADAWRAVRSRLASQVMSEPSRWRDHVEWRGRLRYLNVAAASLEAVARESGAEIVHPFLDPSFVDAVARLRRPDRFANRDGAVRALVGRLLPGKLVTRSTKACFDEVFWSNHARAFAAAWDGGGIDQDLVDADALRGEWLKERPDPRSFLLAQSAWLATATTPFPREGRPRQTALPGFAAA